MDKLSQISKIPETFILTLPQKAWYQQEVVISLLGVVIGFMLGFVATLIKENIQRRNKMRKMIRNLYDEIGINYVQSTISISEITDIKNRFTSVVAISPQSSESHTPRLEYHGSNNPFYEVYFKDLDSLEYELRRRITHFYNVLKSIDNRSKTLANMFKDYYSGNKTVKSGDVLEQLSKLIKQYEAIEVVGAESLAIISLDYKEGAVSNKKEVDYFREKIRNFIETLEVNKKFTLKDVGNSTGIGLITCAHILRTFDDIKSELFGKYEHIKIS
ncbi:MAG: hypothetical protein NTX96_00820 [Candidatus Zambryskibacteria bacterium]|nr:hypothetical protein [Candidatus Zambryskibacteria bacterium]